VAYQGDKFDEVARKDMIEEVVALQRLQEVQPFDMTALESRTDHYWERRVSEAVWMRLSSRLAMVAREQGEVTVLQYVCPLCYKLSRSRVTVQGAAARVTCGQGRARTSLDKMRGDHLKHMELHAAKGDEVQQDTEATTEEEQGQVECGKCDQVFDNKDELREHKKQEHSPEKSTCPFCDQEFNKKFYRDKHIKKVHGVAPPGEKVLACGDCSFTTNKRVALNLHRRKHKVAGFSARTVFPTPEVVPSDFDSDTEDDEELGEKKSGDEKNGLKEEMGDMEESPEEEDKNKEKSEEEVEDMEED